MLQRARAADVPAKWGAADEVDGSDDQFRRCCEQLMRGYVVAISSSTHLLLNGRPTKVSDHFSHCPEGAWQRLSCGSGSRSSARMKMASSASTIWGTRCRKIP